ncbi:unnamed protein product [Rhodiola kirilowii]
MYIICKWLLIQMFVFGVQGLVISCSTMFSSQHLMASDYNHSGNDFGTTYHEAVILSSARDHHHHHHLMTSNTNHKENGNKLEDQEQKLKRRIANRESARRSRLKKQQHLDQLQMLVHKLTNQNQDMRQKLAQLAEYHQQSMMEILRLREELFLLQNAVSNNKLVPLSTNGNNDFTAASNGFGHPH